MKEWLQAYFSFSKKERTGLIVLLTLISLVWLLPRFFGREKPVSAELLERADSGLVVARGTMAGATDHVVAEPREAKRVSLRVFDPNMVSAEEWVQFGVSARTAGTIRKYLERGGKFRQPEDLKRIYSLRPEDAERLMPYVRITQQELKRKFSKMYQPMSKRYEERGGDFRNYVNKPRDRTVDVNAADSSAFETLPLIGPRLAARIVRFRESCGGFYSVDQLAGVYGIHDTVFLRIRPLLRLARPELRKLMLNRWDRDSLAMHPYITAMEARALVNYREQHGPFRELADLEKLALLSAEWIRRVGPYISFD